MILDASAAKVYIDQLACWLWWEIKPTGYLECRSHISVNRNLEEKKKLYRIILLRPIHLQGTLRLQIYQQASLSGYRAWSWRMWFQRLRETESTFRGEKKRWGEGGMTPREVRKSSYTGRCGVKRTEKSGWDQRLTARRSTTRRSTAVEEVEIWDMEKCVFDRLAASCQAAIDRLRFG